MKETWLDQEKYYRDDPVTASKWQSHGVELIRIGILLQWSVHAVKWFGTYFSVPKSETHARAIWNGKKLSGVSKHPPAVNLPYLPDLLKRLSEETRRMKRAPTVLVQDWSAFFHQIPVCQELSEYFVMSFRRKVKTSKRAGRRTKDTVEHYRWTTLPMGWSWSPYVAQSVGLATVLHEEADDEQIYLVPEGLKALPTYIPLKGGGFMCLYYDNLLIAGFDDRIMEEARRRLDRNQKMFNVVVKPGSLEFRRGKDLVVPRVRKTEDDMGGVKPIDYLGAYFFCRYDRAGKVELAWRQKDEKVKALAEDVFPCVSCFPCRPSHRKTRRR